MQNAASQGAPAGVSPGTRIADYLLQEQIGQGGMAVVFRAHDERLDRTVALKVLAPTLAADESFRQRFIRESRAAAAVDDPHIIPVFEAGDAGGVLFIAMRFVRGGDVRTLITEQGRLQPGRAAGIISQAASALDAAHRRGLVHRDVKPANMLLDASGDPGDRPDHVYLSDFGLSKAALNATGLTGTGTFLGTLDYISPEQLEGKPVDGRADQYSLACAAFELLGGVPPFQRDQAMAVMYAQLHDPPAPLTTTCPHLAPEVDEVFAKALAKAPADRYGSCMEFAIALRQALGLPTGGSRPGSAGPAGAAWVNTELAVMPAAAGLGAGDAAAPGTNPNAATMTAGLRHAAAAGPGTPVSAATGPASATRTTPPGTGGAAVQPNASTPASTPAPYPGQAARRSRRPTAALLVVAACILIAAGLVAGAILLKSQHSAATGSTAPPATPARNAGSTPGGSPSASAASGRAHGSPHAQLPRTAGYQLVTTLRPTVTTSISSVAWNPKDTLVAASDKNGMTYVWNAATGSPHGPPLPGPASAYTTAFSPAIPILATGYRYGSTYLWDVATGRRIAMLHDPGPGAGKEVDSVAFSPDGSLLVTSDGNGYANVWDVTGHGRPTLQASLADPSGSGVFSATFSSRGALATGDYDGNVYIWNIAARVPKVSISLGGSPCALGSICNAISALAFSKDGALLAAGTESGAAELWNVRRGLGTQFDAPDGRPAIWGLSFGTSGALAMACGNKNSYLWRVDDASLTPVLTSTLPDPDSGRQGVGTLAFSGDGQYLVTGDTNGDAYLWKAG